MTVKDECNSENDGDKLVCHGCGLRQFPWYHNYCGYCGGLLLLNGKWVGYSRTKNAKPRYELLDNQ